MRKTLPIKNSIILYSTLLVVWGFYRLLFKLPDEIEEAIIKPVLWLGLVYFFLKKEKGPSKTRLASVGITTRNLFPAIYLSFGLGVLFAAEGALLNFVKYKGFNFLGLSLSTGLLMRAFGLSLLTAISEEITFRGYIFSRFLAQLKSEWLANFIVSLGWTLIHIPITIFVWNYTPLQIAGYLILVFIFGLGSGFVFSRTGNIISSILLHFFWEWPIILFR